MNKVVRYVASCDEQGHDRENHTSASHHPSPFTIHSAPLISAFRTWTAPTPARSEPVKPSPASPCCLWMMFITVFVCLFACLRSQTSHCSKPRMQSSSSRRDDVQDPGSWILDPRFENNKKTRTSEKRVYDNQHGFERIFL